MLPFMGLQRLGQDLGTEKQQLKQRGEFSIQEPHLEQNGKRVSG